MNKRFAVPIENGVLCPHFGHCQKFVIIDVKNNVIEQVKIIIPPEHQPGLYPKWIAEHGVSEVIAGGMGHQAINLFNIEKINVFAGAPIKGAKELVEDFLSNKLSLNANYCDH